MGWSPGSNDPAEFDVCGTTTKRCQPVQSPGPTYTIQQGCDPNSGPCTITATVPAFFPGNHQNTTDLGANVLTILFHGAAVGNGNETCGALGDYIVSDRGTVTIGATVQCSTPGDLIWTVRLSDCPFATTGCRFYREFPLDFKAAAGCKVPPVAGCGRGDSAVAGACCIGPGGGGPSIGGGALAIADRSEGATGDAPQTVTIGALGHSVVPDAAAPPGIHLSYTYGGAGAPGYPENSHWIRNLGHFWSHEFAQRIVPAPNETHVWFVAPGASYREFASPDAGGIYTVVHPSDEYRTLEWLGAGQGWLLHGLDGEKAYFRSDGLWDRTEDAHDPPNTIQGTYDPVANRLTTIDFPDGRQVQATYYSDGQLQRLREVGVGGSPTRDWTYEWYLYLGNANVNNDNLRRITRPDGSRWEFLYDSAVIPHMTRMTLVGSGGSPTRIEGAWEYDASGRLYRAWRGATTYDAALDPEKLTWSYPLPDTVQVTDGTGSVQSYVFDRETSSGKARIRSFSGTCSGCGGLPPNSSFDYADAANPLRPTRITDGNGHASVFTYDGNGMETSRTDAESDPVFERYMSWEYQGPFPALVTHIEGPHYTVAPPAVPRTVDLVYDPDGDLRSRTIAGIETDDPLVQTAFSYTTLSNDSIAGAPPVRTREIDPPAYGTDDKTVWTYSDETRGLLVPQKRADPLLGDTTFTWDEFNRKKTETDPNGHKIEWFYDSLDHVTKIRNYGDPAVPTEYLDTLYFYTGLGNLGCLKYPRGNGVQYLYDAVGRLSEEIQGTAQASPTATNCLTSTARERRRFTYSFDATDNNAFVANEKLERWVSGSTWTTDAENESRYSSRCSLAKTIDGANHTEASTIAFTYNCNGALATSTRASGSPVQTTTSFGYDALDRLTSVSQTWGGAGGGTVTTSYGFDAQDHLSSVLDAEGNATTFLTSDRDLLTREVSPVTGTSRFRYNDHGELDEEYRDARSLSIFRTVDAADRTTLVDYPGADLDTGYSFTRVIDIAGNMITQVGHLFEISRAGSTIMYDYDNFWRLRQDGELLFSLDSNGNRNEVSYPQGITSRTTFDYADRPSKLELREGAGGYAYVIGAASGGNSAASYKAFGPLAALPMANGRSENRSYDQRYAPDIFETVVTATPTTKLISWDYTENALGDVTSITDTLNATNNRSFGYQPHQRFLTCASGPWASSGPCSPSPTGGRLEWTYDKIGDRLTEVKSGTSSYSDAYVYVSNGGGGRTSILDRVNRNGPLLRDYTFDGGGFLDSVVAGANTIDFTFDAAGQLSQTSRPAAGETLTYAYDGRNFLLQAPPPPLGDPPCPTPPPGMAERFCDGFESTNTACWSEVVGGTPGGTCPWIPQIDRIEATYSSEGVLQGLDRLIVGQPTELLAVLPFGDRPVATWRKSGTSAATLTYLTTDHLGTPILAMNSSGTAIWSGGFDPFGRDYTNPTAESLGVFLRLPGQWDDPLFADSTLGAEDYYNLYRWYETQIGRYDTPDPLGLRPDVDLFKYARSSPVRWFDRLGLEVVCCSEGKERLLQGAASLKERADGLRSGRGFDLQAGGGPVATTFCGGAGMGQPGTPETFFDPTRYGRLGTCEKECSRVHEASHGQTCRKYGLMMTDRAYDLDEALAYLREGICLLGAAEKGSVDVDKSFPELKPIPSP